MKINNVKKILTVLVAAQLGYVSIASATDYGMLSRRGGSESRGREDERRGRENESEHRSGDHANITSPSRPTTPSSRVAAKSFRLRLRLGDDDTNPSADIRRKVKTKRGAVERDRFTAKVEIPVPNANPAVATLADAEALAIELEISRAGAVYARCQLPLEEIEEDDGVTKAEYKVDIEARVKRGSVSKKVRHGSCDTDLAVAGAENNIPDIQAGDLFEAKVSGQSAFLSGQL